VNKKLRLYLDTTVWNFVFADDAPEYQSATRDFFAEVRRGKFQIFDADTVAEEIDGAPPKRALQIASLMETVRPQRLEYRHEIEKLAETYLKRKALPEKSLADAFHVAYATFYKMDALLSWNFKHLANLGRRRKLVEVNLHEGFGEALQIVTPLEVLGNEEKD
jgi:predicted nucleic acid-binding protein